MLRLPRHAAAAVANLAHPRRGLRAAALSTALAALLLATSPLPAQAQAGDGLRLPAPPAGSSVIGASPAQTLPAGPRWIPVSAQRLLPWQVDLASIVHLEGDRLRYRVRGTRASRGESWVVARCDLWERAELPGRDQADTATLRWRQPLFGHVEDAELAAVCDRSGARTPTPPAWTDADLTAVVGAWQHGVGPRAYELRIADLDTEEDARRARLASWDSDGRWPVVTRRVDGLLDLPQALRVPVAELYKKGERSPALRLTDRQGGLHWLVVEMVGSTRFVAPADRGALLARAQRWVAQGHLPTPAALRDDPAERARALWWAAPQAAQINALPPGLDTNVVYGAAMTPLTQALLAQRADSARALLARGADPNLCGLWGCPLALARLLPDAAEGDALLAELLAAGARPDQLDTRYAAASTTVLTDAAREGQSARIDRLLAAGASPNGAPGARVTPLAMALATGNRRLAERLLGAGASPLPWRDRDLGAYGRIRTIVDAAGESGQAELLDWAEQTMRQAAARSPLYRWDAHIEQDGRVHPLVDGARLVLRAAPFKLVYTQLPGSDTSLTLGASLSPDWAEEVRSGNTGNGIFVPAMSGATAEPPKDESYELFLYNARPADASTPDAHWGGHMTLSPPGPPGTPVARVDFHELRPERQQYVREFRAVYPVPEGSSPGGPARPLAELAGQTLYLALGSQLPLRGWEKSGLVAPRVLSILLR